MQNRQRGMTFIGILVLIVVVGGYIYAGIRVVPKYLEYMRVASTLEKVRDEFDNNPGST
jgi:type II secretory pathway pseudopilin PulG